MASIRDRLKAIERELLPGNIPPATARTSLMTLTALLGPTLDTCRERERLYRLKLADCLVSAKSKAAAEVQAMTAEEYWQYRETEDVKDLIEQMIITCRGYLRSLDEEARLERS